jgi:hypothetical protein
MLNIHERTSNIQHPTSNIEVRKTVKRLSSIRCWMFAVGCSMFVLRQILISLTGGAAFAVAMIALGAGPETEPSTRPAPATQPAAAAAQPPAAVPFRERSSRRNRGNRDAAPAVLATGFDAFSVLKTRSIFVKGNQTIASDSRPVGNSRSGQFAGVQPAALVFNGVILVNGEARALVENRGSNDVATIRTGDPVAGGKVSAITFDELTYEAGGQTQHVAIGENFNGVTPGESYTAGLPVAGATTMPATMPSIGPTNNLSPQDIEAKLRARRKALGGD